MLGLIYVNYVAPFDAMTSFENFTLWGSPNWFGDPQIGSGIPELVWGFARHESPNRLGDPRIVYPNRGSPNQLGDSRDMNPQTNNGIPKSYI